MRVDERSREEGTGRGSRIARVPPWFLAFLLTGCPLDPFQGAGGGPGGTTTSMTSSMSTLTMMAGCSMPSETRDCDDGNPCTVDKCEDGVCSYEPASQGTPCADENACNGDEACDD